MMQQAFILAGSNIGDRRLNLQNILLEMQTDAISVEQTSSVYCTAPWGIAEQQDFYNVVFRVATSLTPDELLGNLLILEKQAGRQRSDEKYGPRIIDLDILFYGNLVQSEPHLTIPHPQLHNRAFTLIPLNEIAPDFIHPVFGKPVHVLLKECPDKLSVKNTGEFLENR